MSGAPLTYEWDGEAMAPLRQCARAADEQFIIGERYQLQRVEPRSLRSHNHYFAALTQAWENLPEHLAEHFPTTEAFRKWCLIKAGWRDERSVTAASKAEAQRIAAFIRPIDNLAVVSVSGSTVVVLTAKSQSMRAMGKADFQRSKDDVLRIASELIGVDAGALNANARSAA